MTARKMIAYNDGVVHICMQNTSPSSFGAKRNNKGLGGLDPLVKLRFCIASKRQEDVEWAERHDVTLSLKIRTPFHPKVKQGMEAVIGDIQYHITQLDHDTGQRELFIYLTEVRRIA